MKNFEDWAKFGGKTDKRAVVALCEKKNGDNR